MKEKFYMKDSPRRNFRGSMKRFATALGLAAIMLLAPAVTNATEYVISMTGPYIGVANKVIIGSGFITLESADPGDTYTVTGTHGSYYININTSCPVTLSGLNLGLSGGNIPITVGNNVNAHIILAGTNSATSTSTVGISVTGGSSLSIGGSGSLTVSGSSTGIGLAGTSSLSITGGTVDITGTTDGISVGANSLTISGGAVTVTGSGGHGIAVAASGSVSISGGTVTLNGSGGNHGINVSGELGISGGTVTGGTGSNNIVVNNGGELGISGGTVNVTRIYNYGTGVIDISGGTVTVTTLSNLGDLDISGGTVTLSGTSTGTLDITGGSVILASSLATAATAPGTIVVLSGLPLNAAVSGTISGYGLNGVKTDGTGQLYLWLPSALASFELTIGTNTYIYSKEGGTWLLVIAPGGDTDSDCGLVKGAPSGWKSAYNTPANVYYSGQEVNVPFTYAPTNTDRTVKIKLTDSVAFYFTAPATVVLEPGQTVANVTLTVKQLPSNLQGKYTLSAGAGAVEAQIGSGAINRVYANAIVPASSVFYNALDLCNTVSITYTPSSPYYNGNIGISVVNGTDYIYRYSLDEGYTWSDALSENSLNITPYSAEYILIKAANSYNYIRFDLVGSGLPPVPPSLTRTVQIPGTAGLGLAVDKGAGVHYVTLGGEFTFTVTPTTPIPAGKTLSVQTDPAAINVEVIPNADGTYTVTIEGISKNTKVSFDIVTDNEGIASTRVYSVGNTLYIATAQAATVQIYSVIGQLVKTVAVSGEATLTLPTGLYMVKTADRVYKISIR